MSEHLVDADDVRRIDEEARRGFERAIAEEQAGKARKTYLEPPAKAINAIDRRAELLQLVSGYRTAQGRPRADGLRRPDRARRPARRRPARGGRARAGALQGRAARRVPGHLGRAGHDAVAAVLRARPRPRPRPPGDGGRRPQPGDLRLARRLGVQHPQLRRHLPGRRRRARPAAADGQPALRPPDPRGRQPARRAAARRAYGDKVARLRAPRPRGEGRVETHVFERAVDELAWLAAEVQRVHDAGTPWSDIGVLSRDNAQARRSTTPSPPRGSRSRSSACRA